MTFYESTFKTKTFNLFGIKSWRFNPNQQEFNTNKFILYYRILKGKGK